MEAIFMFRTGETFDLDCLSGRRFNATSMYREHTFYLQYNLSPQNNLFSNTIYLCKSDQTFDRPSEKNF